MSRKIGFGLLLWLFVLVADTAGAKQPARVYEAAQCYTDHSNSNYFHTQKHKDLNGNEVNFQKYRGKVSLVVNVASFWALTNATYTELNVLVSKYGPNSMYDQNGRKTNKCSLQVLGFPCNQVKLYAFIEIPKPIHELHIDSQNTPWDPSFKFENLCDFDVVCGKR